MFPVLAQHIVFPILRQHILFLTLRQHIEVYKMSSVVKFFASEDTTLPILWVGGADTKK